MRGTPDEIIAAFLTHLQAGRVDEAEALLEDALADDPDWQRGWETLAGYRFAAGGLQRFRALVSALLPRMSDPEPVMIAIANDLLHRGYVEDGLALVAALREVRCDSLHVDAFELFCLATYGDDEDAAFAAYHRWNATHGAVQDTVPFENDRTPDRPLRVGFIASDYGGGHSFTSYLASWFHRPAGDSDRYILYSDQNSEVPPHPVFTEAADAIVNIHGLPIEEIQARARADGIDIMVGLVSGGVLSWFSTMHRRAAPVTAGCFFGGMVPGMASVDYLLGDKYVAPPDRRGKYVENVVYLPRTHTTWSPPEDCPPVNSELPAARRGAITFGNLNRPVKFSAAGRDLWDRVLKALPDATMLFKYAGMEEPGIQSLVLESFARHGVGPERVQFLGRSNQYDHLDTYNEIDIMLDCVPQHGGITSLEALWMGVPVVSMTVMGLQPGLTSPWALNFAGLDNLATADPDSFIAAAVALAEDRDRLAAYRSAARDIMARSAVRDVDGFGVDLKRAFREMWRRYCADEAPAPFDVGAG